MQIKSSVQVTSKIYQVISASKLQVVVGTKSLHNLKERMRNILRMCLEDTFYVYHRAHNHYIVFFSMGDEFKVKITMMKKSELLPRQNRQPWKIITVNMNATFAIV